MSDTWGKGVINNTIGWGRGSDNATNGWGSIYASSNSGETALRVGFDPDAASFFTAIEDAGGTLSDNVKEEYNAFVVREKDAGRYSKIKRLYPFLGGTAFDAGDPNYGSIRVDAITTNLATNFNFVDADVDPLVGVTPDGSTKRLEGNLPSEIWNDDNIFQMGGFLKGATFGGAGTNPILMGTLDTSSFAYYSVNRNTAATTWQGKAGGTGNLPNQTLTGTNEHIGIARFSDTVAYTVKDITASAVYSVLNTSTLASNVHDFSYFAASVNASRSNYTTQATNSIYQTEFATLSEYYDFITSYETFLTNIGAI